MRIAELPSAPPVPDPPDTGSALAAIEVVPADVAPRATGAGVTLRGEAARSLRESLGAAVVKSGWRGRRAAETTYRLVPSEQAARGLADGSLVWATASKGDASVLIRDKATGRFAGRAELHKVRASPAKVLGPAAWEALAMATQQHYLVEIGGKLASIEQRVDEVLARMDDDTRGTLKQIRGTVAASRQRLAEGRPPSAGRREELRDGVRDADRVWHRLHERVARTLGAYRAGTTTADEVEKAWADLLLATQVLGDASAFLTALPYETVDALEDTNAEERDRVLAAVAQVQATAGELHAAHLDWSAQNAAYRLRHTRNPAKKAVRAVRSTQAVKPAQQPLDDVTAWRASQLAVPAPPPAALLITVGRDESVRVVAEQSAGDDGTTGSSRTP